MIASHRLIKRQRIFCALGVMLTGPALFYSVLWLNQDTHGDVLSLIEFLGILILTSLSVGLGLLCFGIAIGLRWAGCLFKATEQDDAN